MMKVVLAIVAVLSASPSMAYDDPAVAVCEWFVKDGLSEHVEYKRVSSAIDANEVILLYEVSALNTKPRESATVCRFTEARPGFFELVVQPPDDGGVCDERDYSSSELDAMPTSELKAIRDRVEQCQRYLSLASRWLEIVHRDLQTLPFYPIALGDTELRTPAAEKGDRLAR